MTDETPVESDQQPITPPPGPEPEKEKEPEEKTPAAAPPAPPENRDWKPIDFSHGTIKTGIFGNLRGFKYGVKKELKKDLGTVLNTTQRGIMADEMAKLRKGGLGALETRKKLKELVKRGVIDKFEAKKIKRDFRAYK